MAKSPKPPLTALRQLTKSLEGETRTGKEKGLPNDIAYDDGVVDGLNQAGYQLTTLLEEYGLR